MTKTEVKAIQQLIVAMIDESRGYPRTKTQKEREDRVNKAFDRLEKMAKDK